MTYVKEIAIIGLIAIELYALNQGIDGTLLAGICSLIAGIAGFYVGKKEES